MSDLSYVTSIFKNDFKTLNSLNGANVSSILPATTGSTHLYELIMCHILLS